MTDNESNDQLIRVTALEHAQRLNELLPTTINVVLRNAGNIEDYIRHGFISNE